MKKIIQKQLGELLVDCKLLTQEQLDEAVSNQKTNGGLLGQILVSLGYVSEEAIAQALTAQYGFPYLPLAGYEIDAEVAKIIPEHVAKQYGLVAVDKVGSILTIAMSNPLNASAIQDIETLTNFKVQVFVTTTSDVTHAIRNIYKG
jgi:type IV pilus assembly protein PilB